MPFCSGERVSDEITGPQGLPGEQGLPGDPVLSDILFYTRLFSWYILRSVLCFLPARRNAVERYYLWPSVCLSVCLSHVGVLSETCERTELKFSMEAFFDLSFTLLSGNLAACKRRVISSGILP